MVRKRRRHDWPVEINLLACSSNIIVLFRIGLIDRMKFGTTTYLHVTHPVFDFTAPIRLRFGISCSLRQEAQGPPLSTPFFISKDSCFLGMVLS
jgi:hypothetical protein